MVVDPSGQPVLQPSESEREREREGGVGWGVVAYTAIDQCVVSLETKRVHNHTIPSLNFNPVVQSLVAHHFSVVG